MLRKAVSPKQLPVEPSPTIHLSPHFQSMSYAPPLTILALAFFACGVFALLRPNLKPLAFPLLVIACGLGAFVHPSLFTQWGTFELRKIIGPLVQVILLGMGMTLTWADCQGVLKRPASVLAGAACQYTVMPVCAFILVGIFNFPAEIALGLILIGCCPGGVSSNVLVYLAKGNVAFSVAMTLVSTLLSPFLTPLLIKLLAGELVTIPFLTQFWQIQKLVIIPLILGFLIRRYLPGVADALTKVVPTIAMLSICAIIGITIALSRADLVQIGMGLLIASLIHNLCFTPLLCVMFWQRNVFMWVMPRGILWRVIGLV